MKKQRKDYIRPKLLEVFRLPLHHSILIQLSGETEFDDFLDGGEMGDE